MKNSKICDICGVREAKFEAVAIINGVRKTFHLCEVDYEIVKRLQAENISLSDLLQNEDKTRDIFNLQNGPYYEADEEWMKLTAETEEGEDLRVEDYFSDSLRRLIDDARGIAASFVHTELLSEDVLYALLQDDHVDGLLQSLDLDTAEIRKQIDHLTPKTYDTSSELYYGSDMLISARVYDFLEKAFVISKELEFDSILPIHLLIALLSEGTSSVITFFKEAGADPYNLREDLINASKRMKTLYETLE